MKHWSDCAVHNSPAQEPGPCDCGGLELAEDTDHDLVIPLVATPRRMGGFTRDDGSRGLVNPQELPADSLSADASPSDLPDTHDDVAILGVADRVDLDVSVIAVIPKFKDTSQS